MPSINHLSTPVSGASQTSVAETITAIDMTGDPDLRGLWFPGHNASAELAARAKLPAGGFASPLGYWLVAHDGLAPLPSDGMRLVVTVAGEGLPELAAKPGGSGQAGRRFRTHMVKI